MHKPKVYLAGPDVFLPDAIELGRYKKDLCAKYGLEGLHPFDNEILPNEKNTISYSLIYRANKKMIHEADAGIFNLTPFRSVSADVGTVFELGMLVGLRKPAFGYTNNAEDLLERIKSSDPVTFDAHRVIWYDSNGMTIENYNKADNLMIEAALEEQGHPIIRRSVPDDQRLRDLTGFEMCLKLAAQTLG